MSLDAERAMPVEKLRQLRELHRGPWRSVAWPGLLPKNSPLPSIIMEMVSKYKGPFNILRFVLMHHCLINKRSLLSTRTGMPETKVSRQKRERDGSDLNWDGQPRALHTRHNPSSPDPRPKSCPEQSSFTSMYPTISSCKEHLLHASECCG